MSVAFSTLPTVISILATTAIVIIIIPTIPTPTAIIPTIIIDMSEYVCIEIILIFKAFSFFLLLLIF
jgi:hypothetical protein